MSSSGRRGFVLLEAVIALLVIGLAAAGALELTAAHLRAAAREPVLLTAAALAQDRIAAVRLLEPDALRRLPDSVANGRFPAPFEAYRWHATARRSVEESLYDIRVDVSWAGGDYTLASRQSAPALAATGVRR
jgi:type II secretory pathway pseudopilin PulG